MIRIREMNLDDIERVLEIERVSFARPLSRNSLEKELTNNDIARYYLLEDKEDILGYFGFWIIGSQGHILNIAVDKKYRSKGYGKELVKNLIEKAAKENISQLTLEVRESNEAARNLYRLFNFKELGQRPNYYSDPKEDAIIMWLDMEENCGNNQPSN